MIIILLDPPHDASL